MTAAGKKVPVAEVGKTAEGPATEKGAATEEDMVPLGRSEAAKLVALSKGASVRCCKGDSGPRCCLSRCRGQRRRARVASAGTEVGASGGMWCPLAPWC